MRSAVGSLAKFVGASKNGLAAHHGRPAPELPPALAGIAVAEGICGDLPAACSRSLNRAVGSFGRREAGAEHNLKRIDSFKPHGVNLSCVRLV